MSENRKPYYTRVEVVSGQEKTPEIRELTPEEAGVVQEIAGENTIFSLIFPDFVVRVFNQISGKN